MSTLRCQRWIDSFKKFNGSQSLDSLTSCLEQKFGSISGGRVPEEENHRHISGLWCQFRYEVVVGVRPRSQKQKHVTTCPLPPPWPQSRQGSAPQPQPHFHLCPAQPSMATNHLIWVSLARVLSRFSHVWLFVTLWTVAYQALLSMGFSRQEYWSGLPFPAPGNLSDPVIKPASLVSPALAGRFFATSTTWEALSWY